MTDDVYHKLAKVLDTLPNGFPSTESGVEIKILKKIFTPEEADLFCDLKLTPETAEQISERTGRSPEGLEEMLTSMWERGEVFGTDSGGVKTFRMVPWAVGLFEFQLDRMDREFAEMCEEFSMYWGPQFLEHGPKAMQVVPIEKEIPSNQKPQTFDQVSAIIENAVSYKVNTCICKKEQGLLDNPCEKPHEICLAMSSEPDAFKNSPWSGKIISKEEAYEVLRKSEEAGLVHLTSNVEEGHWFICNCCGCCCGMLRAINMGLTDVLNVRYYATIDPDECTLCGVCADERCQINAIEEGEDAYQVVTEKCIGCGLCASTCPTEAITLVQHDEEKLVPPVRDENAWLEERARQRGVDISDYQ